MGNLCSFCYLCGKEFDLFALESHKCDTIEDEDYSININESINEECDTNDGNVSKDNYDHITNNLAEKRGEGEAKIEAKNDTSIDSSNDKVTEKADIETKSDKIEILSPSNKLIENVSPSAPSQPSNETTIIASESGNNQVTLRKKKQKREDNQVKNESAIKDQTEAAPTNNVENVERAEDCSAKEATRNMESSVKTEKVDSTEASAVCMIPKDESKITVEVKRELIEKTDFNNSCIDSTEEDSPPVVLDGNDPGKVEKVNGIVKLEPDSDKRDEDHGASAAAADNRPPALYCEFCGTISSCFFELTVHKDFIHENHYFDCFLCGGLFKRTSELVFHYKSKHDTSKVRLSELDSFKYYCSQCGQGFNYVYMLLDHKKRLIESKRHVVERQLNAVFVDDDVEFEGMGLKSESDDSGNVLPMGNDTDVLIASEPAGSQKMCPGFQADASKTITCELKSAAPGQPSEAMVDNRAVSSTSIVPSAQSKLELGEKLVEPPDGENIIQKSEVSKRHSKTVAEETKSQRRSTKVLREIKSHVSTNIENDFRERPKTNKCDNSTVEGESRKGEKKKCKKLSGENDKNKKSEENQEKKRKRKRSNSNSNKYHFSKEKVNDRSTSEDPGPSRKKSNTENIPEQTEKINKETTNKTDKKYTKALSNDLKERKSRDELSKYPSSGKNHDRDKYKKVSRSKSDGDTSKIAKTNVPPQGNFEKVESVQPAGHETTADALGPSKSMTSFRKYLNKGPKSILLNDQGEEIVSYAQYKLMRSTVTKKIAYDDSIDYANVPPSPPLRRVILGVPQSRPLQQRRASIHMVQEDVRAAEFSDEPDTDEEIPQECELSLFCEVCGMKGTNFETLRDHREEVHRGFKFKCFVCDMGFDNIDALIRHQAKYSKSVLSAAESRFLRQRKSLPNQLNPYNCGFCGLGFTLIELFVRHRQDRHMKKRGGMRKSDAGGKGKKGNENNNIKVNSAKETGVYSEQSEVLLEALVRSSRYTSPEATVVTPGNETNTNFMEFCELCGQKYSSPEDKQKHFHLQNFVCVICRRTFEDLSLLANHYDLCHQKHEILNFEMTEVSIGESFKYYCKFCGMGFYFVNQVLAHKEVQHFEESANNSTAENKSKESPSSLAAIFAKPKVIPGLDFGIDSGADDRTTDVSSPNRFMDLHEYLEQNNVCIGSNEEDISSSTVAGDTWIEAADQLTSLLNEATFMDDLNKGIEDSQSTTNDSSANVVVEKPQKIPSLIAESKENASISMGQPICSAKFDHWFELNEQRITECSATGHPESREAASSNSNSSKKAERILQCLPPKSDQNKSTKKVQASDIECAVSITTTEVAANEKEKYNISKDAKVFLRKCDCREIFVTQKKWNEHTLQCPRKKQIPKKETARPAVPPDKKLTPSVVATDKKLAVCPDKKSTRPTVPPDKKITCPVCPNGSFINKEAYKCHARDNRKHQQYLHKLQSQPSESMKKVDESAREKKDGH